MNRSRRPKPNSQHRLPAPARQGQLATGGAAGSVVGPGPLEAPGGGGRRGHWGRRTMNKNEATGESKGGRWYRGRPAGAQDEREDGGKAAGTSWERSCVSLFQPGCRPAAKSRVWNFLRGLRRLGSVNVLSVPLFLVFRHLVLGLNCQTWCGLELWTPKSTVWVSEERFRTSDNALFFFRKQKYLSGCSWVRFASVRSVS
jgi:hypothetical protein